VRARAVRTNGLVLAVALGLAVPAAAGRQAPDDPVARAQALADAELKAQLTAFSYVLREAVERGGQRLAEWAGQIVPGIELVLAANPTVEATPLPDGSVVFDVRIPEILQTSMMLFLRQRPQPGATPITRGPVTGTGVVTGDPMTVPPPGAERSLNPNQQYSDFVREALVDGIINNAGILPLDNGTWLTVAASGADVAVTNPLYRNTSRKLILSLKGDDLQALRRGDLTRDQVRARVVERRY